MSASRHDLGGDTHIVSNDAALPSPGKASVRKFVVASSVGVLAFLVPFTVDGSWQILIGYLSDTTRQFFGAGMPWMVFGLLFLSVFGTFVAYFTDSQKLEKYPVVRKLFLVSPAWAAVRFGGLVMCAMTLFQWGPEMIWHANTGGTVVNGLAVNIVFIFLFAGFLMPFLTEYGLMEFLGTFLKRSFRRLFTLPGRSAIDALASWMSASAIGVLITIDQYLTGHYSRREAAVIATNFSVVSLPFTLVVANTVGMDSHFIYFYFVVVVAGVALAVITPRIPPLSLFEDKPYDRFHPDRETFQGEGTGVFTEAVTRGAMRAQNAAPLGVQFRTSFGHVLDIWFGLLPAVIAIGGAGLILAEYTPVLSWLAMPFVPFLDLLAIPDPLAASEAMLSGFLDMFLPALLVANLDSEITRFVIGVLSVTQLIYMSEIGILLIKCEIPLRFHHLIILFVMRTVIALPIIAAFAHLVF